MSLDMDLGCRNCGTVGLKPLFNPEHPPDPDRYGNRRWPYKCPDCKSRGAHVTGGRAGRFFEGCVEKVKHTVPLP